MSYRALLRHRGTIKRPMQVVVDGVSSYDWKTVKTNVKCRADLSYIRKGKDPQWSPEAGRPEDRNGVLFLLKGEPLRTGDRVIMTSGGVAGTFVVDGTIEEILGNRGEIDHLEAPIKEVPGPLAKAVS